MLSRWHSKKAPREQQNNGITAFTLHQPQGEQQTLDIEQLWSTRRAHRMSHVNDGRLYVVNATFPLSAETTPAQSSWDDTSGRVEYGFPSVRTPSHQHIPKLELLEGSPRGTSPTDNALPQLNKDLPNAPMLPEIESPDAGVSVSLVIPLKARPHHDEMFLELDASNCLLPQPFKGIQQMLNQSRKTQSQPHEIEATHTTVHELPGGTPHSTLHHPKPTNLAVLTRRSYILQYGTEVQLAVLDAWRGAENAREPLEMEVVTRRDIPVPHEPAAGAPLSPERDKEDQQATPVYSHYTEMRCWDYEDVEEAYNKAVAGPATLPASLPARHSGGFEWFYASKK
jgi:hypothetical protein